MTPRPSRPRTLAAVALSASALGGALIGGAAAAAAAPPPSRTYIGTVDGADAFAAVVTRGDVAVAYVCNGRRIAVWLKGSFVGGRLDLASRRGDTLTGTLRRGTLDLTDRQPLSVRTAFSPLTDRARFFIGSARIGGTGWAGGWITLADGRQRGALRDDDGRVFATRRVTTTTAAVAAPGGGTVGVSEYLKDWDKIPKRVGGAAA